MSQRTRFTAAEVVTARYELNLLTVDQMLERGFIDIPAVLHHGKPDRFQVVMEKVADGRTIHTIKEIRSLTGLGLAASKALCDTTPSTIVTDLDRAHANAAAAQLREAGATVHVRGWEE